VAERQHSIVAHKLDRSAVHAPEDPAALCFHGVVRKSSSGMHSVSGMGLIFAHRAQHTGNNCGARQAAPRGIDRKYPQPAGRVDPSIVQAVVIYASSEGRALMYRLDAQCEVYRTTASQLDGCHQADLARVRRARHAGKGSRAVIAQQTEGSRIARSHRRAALQLHLSMRKLNNRTDSPVLASNLSQDTRRWQARRPAVVRSRQTALAASECEVPT